MRWNRARWAPRNPRTYAPGGGGSNGSRIEEVVVRGVTATALLSVFGGGGVNMLLGMTAIQQV